MTQATNRISSGELKELVETHLDLHRSNPQKAEQFDAQLKDMARQGFFTFDEFNQMCDKLGEKVRSSSPKATQSQRPAPQGKVHTSSRRHPGKVLAIAFKVMRGLVAALNIVPYQAMVTTIVPMTGAAEVYDMISGVSILGDVFNFAIAAIVWYAFQWLETMKGSGAGIYLLRTLTYAADAWLCFLIFPPLIGGTDSLWLFGIAGVGGDLDLKNLMISISTVGGWEFFDWVEGVVFPTVPRDFWGVKLRAV